MVVGGILVFFMQAGFALIESGSVRSKNTVNVLMKNYMDTCIGGLIFWLFGFGLMFGLNQTGWIGLSHFMPDQLDDWHWNLLFFQMMFAATATTIASGAMAERIHFVAYVVSAIFVSGVIYPIFGSWAWGGLFGGEGSGAEGQAQKCCVCCHFSPFHHVSTCKYWFWVVSVTAYGCVRWLHQRKAKGPLSWAALR